MCQTAKDGKGSSQECDWGRQPSIFNRDDKSSSKPKENSNCFLSRNFKRTLFKSRRTNWVTAKLHMLSAKTGGFAEVVPSVMKNGPTLQPSPDSLPLWPLSDQMVSCFAQAGTFTKQNRALSSNQKPWSSKLNDISKHIWLTWCNFPLRFQWFTDNVGLPKLGVFPALYLESNKERHLVCFLLCIPVK